MSREPRTTPLRGGGASLTRRASVVAPYLSLLLIGCLSWALPNRTPSTEQALAHNQAVASAFADAAWLIGDWSGRDEVVPREAQELLRPNAIFSRRYTSLGIDQRVPWVHVLIVHCNDARDMTGHYPPVCYPNTGWEMVEPVGSETVVLSADGMELPVRVYEFRRTIELGRTERYRIFNTFILPGGEVTYRIEDVRKKSERLALAVRGVAQIQVVSGGELDPADAVQAANDLLEGMAEVFQVLREKTGSQT